MLIPAAVAAVVVAGGEVVTLSCAVGVAVVLVWAGWRPG